jgi:hypothetical protein
VGTYFLASDPGVYLPFEYNRSTGNYRTLQATDDSYKAGASDLVDQPGVEGVVGTYETTGGEMYGWSGNPSATWPGSRLDFGLNQASVTGTGWNNWVGDYVNGDGNPRSFYAYWDSLIGDYQVLTSFGFPDWEHALFQDVTEDEIIVGYYPDHIRTNGFLYDYRNDVYTEFTIPGAEQTMIDGISKNGILTGGYVDSNGIEHGFMATPIPEPGLIIVLACSLPLLRRK